MIILVVILIAVLVIALIYLLVVLHRIRSEERKGYHARVVVSDGNVVTHAAADKNDLIYGENQYNDTILPGDMGGIYDGGSYVLYLTQTRTGYTQQMEIANALCAGRAESAFGHMHIEGKGISRRHCRFFLSEGLLYVEDLGSSNGTFVNGERILGPVLLQNYDTVSLGNVPFEVHLEMVR